MVAGHAWMLASVITVAVGAVAVLVSGPAEAAPAEDGVRAAFVVAPGAIGAATLHCPPGTRVRGDRMVVVPAGAAVIQLSSTASGAPHDVAISVMNEDAGDVSVVATAGCVPLGETSG